MMRSIQPPHVVTIADLRERARRRLPQAVFDYIDGGAETERTMRDNESAFDQVLLRPRSAVATYACALETTVLAQPIAMPVICAPVGSSRLFWPRGEEQAARAAGKSGTIYALSTLSGCRLEDVKAATPGPAWYQLYLIGGRDVALGAIARARAAGYSALVVTVDTPVAGMRERDWRNGVKELIAQNLSSLPYLGPVIQRPGWLWDTFRDGGLMQFPNIVLPQGPMAYADVTAALEQSMISWADFRWIRDAWQGPIVAKGAHTADDALQAMDHGADAVVVSNHGGRQLDGVAATLRVLPEIVDAVDGRVEVLLDGGVRRGSDVVKAISMGARAVLVGRAYAYGLAAAGEAGVSRALEILRTDTVRTLKLLGCASVAALDRSYVRVPADWSA